MGQWTGGGDLQRSCGEDLDSVGTGDLQDRGQPMAVHAGNDLDPLSGRRTLVCIINSIISIICKLR
jgi:hypothetical protein